MTDGPSLDESVEAALEALQAGMEASLDFSVGMMEISVEFDTQIQANNKTTQSFGKIQ